MTHFNIPVAIKRPRDNNRQANGLPYFEHYCSSLCLIKLTYPKVGETKLQVGRPVISQRMFILPTNICEKVSFLLDGRASIIFGLPLDI